MEMDDSINRQAAIDVLSECREYLMRALDDMDVVGQEREKVSYGLGLIESCAYDIADLPSAQPEPRWIPVTERLPEEYTRVIGYMAWKAMTTIEYQHGRWYSIDHLEPLPDEAVSHWMPLPQPPKEVDE